LGKNQCNKSFLGILLLCCLLLPAKLLAAGDAARGVSSILSAAESVFQSMSQAAYPALWDGLSSQSRQNIIKNVRKAISKSGFDYAEERIRADFAAGGELARDYWTNYVLQFEPKLVLEESKWTMGELKNDTAEIIIRHKKSDRDAILKMFREEGAWKVGLEETFSTRR
jgi:hypothetical protein